MHKMITSLLVLILAFGMINKPFLAKTYNFWTLFNENNIVENFRTVDSWGVDYNIIHSNNGDNRNIIPRDTLKKSLPLTFDHNNRTYNFADWLKNYWTTGLIVLKVNNVTNGTIIYEKYYRGNAESTKTISWSMGKSIVSALIGVAVDKGLIDINQTVREYLPKFEGSAYGNVTIRNLLTMSSGIRFDENYFNILSDINIFGLFMILDQSLENLLMSYQKEFEQGEKFNYISADTQVLGLVLSSVINIYPNTLSLFLQNSFWGQISRSSAGWLKSGNQELAFGTIFALLEDYARFGWLYLNKGKSPINGDQLISEEWVNESTRAHSVPKPKTESKSGSESKNNFGIGYGYQWWVSEDDTDYMAIGVYNQFIYVSPKHSFVIVKSSAYPYYYNDMIESEQKALSAFRTMANHF